MEYIAWFFIVGTLIGIGMITYQLLKAAATGAFEFYGGIFLVFVSIIGLLIVVDSLHDLKPIYENVGRVVLAVVVPTTIVVGWIAILSLIKKVD